MSLNNYDFNFENWINDNLHPERRRPKRIAFLKALQSWLRKLHTEFIEYTQTKFDEIKWNGQTIKLEALLIERFGTGIYIETNLGDFDGAIVGAGADIESFIGTGSDVNTFVGVSYVNADYDFTVHVPSAITFSLSEMQALINRYKLMGTTYNIEII
jgi:hypothetical protein